MFGCLYVLVFCMCFVCSYVWAFICLYVWVLAYLRFRMFSRLDVHMYHCVMPTVSVLVG
jgi:hypothetical protein